MEDFSVIGHAYLSPITESGADEKEIATALAKYFMREFAAKLQVRFIEVRYPGFGIIRFHKDTGALDGEWMAMWCSKEPTEILFEDGVVKQGDPGDLVLFNNFNVKHHTPLSAQRVTNRWCVRMGCYNPPPAGEKVKVRLLNFKADEARSAEDGVEYKITPTTL